MVDEFVRHDKKKQAFVGATYWLWQQTMVTSLYAVRVLRQRFVFVYLCLVSTTAEQAKKDSIVYNVHATLAAWRATKSVPSYFAFWLQNDDHWRIKWTLAVYRKFNPIK